MPSSKKKKRTDQEANDAVRVLADYLDDDEDFLLMYDPSVPVALVAVVLDAKSCSTERKRIGTIEYQVGDGPIGRRGCSGGFYALKEAVAYFKTIQEKGWAAR